VIFASVSNFFFQFAFLEFLLIIFLAFICDFDVFFAKFAKDHNHRMLITHSIIPSIVIIILGLIFLWPALVIGGIVYFVHIIVDSFDWGTNFFYFPKKPFGLKLLILDEELQDLPKYLSEYKNPESFFDSKYYGSRFNIAFEIILFILMVITILIFALEYTLVILLYFVFLTFHLLRHYRLKKIEAS